MSYSSPSMGKGIFIAPKLITHREYSTTKPLCLNLHPYPICNLMFHCCNIVVASCQCVYHSWCFNFQLQLSTSCARKTCGKTFKEEWKINMGYKTCKELRHGKLFEHAFIKFYMAINFVRIYMSNFYIVVSLSLGPHLLFHNVFFQSWLMVVWIMCHCLLKQLESMTVQKTM
jgi:hypothetical protein